MCFLFININYVICFGTLIGSYMNIALPFDWLKMKFSLNRTRFVNMILGELEDAKYLNDSGTRLVKHHRHLRGGTD